MDSKFDFDAFIEELTHDIEIMAYNKDIRQNIVSYANNKSKILEAKKKLKDIEKEFNEGTSCDENSSEELIDDNQFVKYLKELDEMKKNLNSSLKLNELLDIYKNSIDKINMCRDYLKNQKIEVINID